MMRVTNRWVVGEYVIEEVEGHGFSDWQGQPLYRFHLENQRQGLNELFPSLDYALVAAVGQKWTGHRGAGGSGVDTAAGWFMKMIGADRLLEEDDSIRELDRSLNEGPNLSVPESRKFGARMILELKRRGFGLARRH